MYRRNRARNCEGEDQHTRSSVFLYFLPSRNHATWDSARCATVLNTSRRIAPLLGRMKNQYIAKARRVPGSGARTRVSVLRSVPSRVGSKRNSIPALIHPGCDQARKAAASSCGGVNPPNRRQAWLSPAEITTSARSENRTGMGVTSRKERPANGCCFLPERRA